MRTDNTCSHAENSTLWQSPSLLLTPSANTERVGIWKYCLPDGSHGYSIRKVVQPIAFHPRRGDLWEEISHAYFTNVVWFFLSQNRTSELSIDVRNIYEYFFILVTDLWRKKFVKSAKNVAWATFWISVLSFSWAPGIEHPKNLSNKVPKNNFVFYPHKK